MTEEELRIRHKEIEEKKKRLENRYCLAKDSKEKKECYSEAAECALEMAAIKKKC